MLYPEECLMRTALRTAWLMPLLIAAIPVSRTDASEIPAFARRYRASCSLCHTAVPKLGAFGEVFAGNGFRMSSEEPPRDTIGTGDPLLDLYRDLPLAVRLDLYANLYANGETATDLQTPYGLKLLGGGPISKKLSYYFYFFLFERGEIAGVEDAFVYLNDVGNAPVDLMAGQFQISDPMFKRELRLEYQDYAIYRTRVGDDPTDLTYDRGLAVMADAAGFTFTGEVLNGNGKGEAESNRHFDNDPVKNVFGHLTRDLFPGVRLGAMGFYGKQRAGPEGGPFVRNTTWMIGGDATITAGSLELNAQFIHREDDNPTFTAGEETAKTDGGFAELVIHPAGSRWYGIALYNLIDANRPLLDPRLGGPAGVDRYHAFTGGAGYLVRRNFRVHAEGTWDFEIEEARLSVGFTTAF